ncbi:MAG: LPXTG cell wall anchor domain-containing protein [Ruminococcus sp.]|nr:LPXTG cell wall anchor domain-containing protein [Ruminococcus sp.]
MFLWIYDNSGTKILGYSTFSGNNDTYGTIKDALTYTDSEATWYLIPLSYFTEALSSYGYRFDASECPFQYAPDAENSKGNLTNAFYVSVDGEYYVRVKDTTPSTYSPRRTNIYYTKDYTRVYDTIEGVSPSGTIINLFDYWTTGQDDVDASASANSDTGINAGHALKFAFNPGQWSVTKNTAYNYWTKSSAVYPDIVQNTLGTDGYPALNSAVTGDDESLAYLFNPNVSIDGKESFTKVKNLLQVDSSGYYYYDCADNYAVYDEDENSFILYDDWAIYSGSTQCQFFPFKSLESLNSSDPQTKSGNDSEMNHYFGMTLTTRFTQQYDGWTSSKKGVATTFEFSGDDDVWIFIDGVLVADLGGIHSAASVSINFATGEVTINGKVTNTIGSAFEAAGVYEEYLWNETNTNTFDNNTYHTLKFYYLERGNSASDLSLKYNLTVIPETGIYKVNQYENPIEGAGFATYHATVDDDGNYYYVFDDGITTESAVSVSEKIDEGTYTIDDNDNICDSGGNIIISSLYSGTTDANGQMIFLDEYSMPYTLTELQQMFGTYFILKETKVPEGYRLVSQDIYLQIVSSKVLVCNNTYDSGVYAATNMLVTAPDVLCYLDESAGDYTGIDYYDVTNGEVNGTLFAVVLKYVGDNNAANDLTKTNWRPVYGSDETGYDVMDEYSLENVIYAAQQMEANGYSDSVFTISGSGCMQVALTALPGDIQTYYYLAENKDDTQYTVAYYWTSASSLDEATAENTVNVESAGVGTEYSEFYRTYGATIEVPNLTNVLLVQKMDEDGNLINGAKFALYEVEEDEATSTIYYIGYAADDTSKSTEILIYLSPDDDCDSAGEAALKDGGTGTYTVNPGEGADGEENEGVITVTIDGATYYIYPVEVETTSPEGTQTSAVSGMTYDTSEGGTAVFDQLTETTYYVREISAPEGFILNPAETMVLVTGDTIYANAGTSDNGVTVARAAGYIVATLDQMAAVGDIDNTLSWVYTTMHINTSQSNTFDFDYYDSSSANWYDLLTSDETTQQHAYLTYDEDESRNDSLFDYVINQDRANAEGNTGTLRLYTDEGWSYLEIYQDTEYHNEREASGESTSYSYTSLDEPITNLFSRTVYIQVTNKKTEVSFVKIDNDTVMLDSDKYLTSATALYGAEFIAYPVDNNGEQIADSNTYTVISDSDGVVTFSGLPLGQKYKIQEADSPTGYTISSWYWLVTISESGAVTSFEAVDDTGNVSIDLIYTSVDETEPDVYSVEDGGNYITYYWPNVVSPRLPDTGGSGTRMYTITGLLLCSGSITILYGKRKKRLMCS